jgi:hypothetical protein
LLINKEKKRKKKVAENKCVDSGLSFGKVPLLKHVMGGKATFLK